MYGAAAGLHKTGGGGGGVVWHFFYLIFRRIIFLHLEIALLFAELRYVFEENIFFRHHNFMKKVILSRLKMNLKIHTLR